MTEFLKGYAAGANDMEAGRLVTKPTITAGLPGDTIDAEGNLHRARPPFPAQIESLRDQLFQLEQDVDTAEQASALHLQRAKAAEAENESLRVKLSGVEDALMRECESTESLREQLKDSNAYVEVLLAKWEAAEAKLAEVETSLKATETRLALVEKDRDRLRRRLARLLSGDE